MKLELYKFDTCPYCRRVMNSIEKSGRKNADINAGITERIAE